ncbi:MAG: helix-turn-helix domain-containing protein [Actinomycetota bacterium]
MPIQSVAVLALPGVGAFELGVACEGFGEDRSDQGVPRCDFAVVSIDDRPVPTSNGWSVTTPHRLDRADEADLVVVPACDTSLEQPGEVLDVLRRAVDRGARVMSICSGAFVLGAAGLLDGRRCTTHWFYADALKAAYPRARVDPDVLYVCDGPVLTSAGSAAGLDLCLHLIRADYGERIANTVARRMVMPPHRDGGQAQFVDAPVRAHSAETLAPLLDDIIGDLEAEHTIETMAARAAMSERTFARHFLAETGTTPHVWLTRQRVLRARNLLESGDDPIEAVARHSGFGTAAMLRHHFSRIVGTSPISYRRTFRR